jgi:hypothetical protein
VPPSGPRSSSYSRGDYSNTAPPRNDYTRPTPPSYPSSSSTTTRAPPTGPQSTSSTGPANDYVPFRPSNTSTSTTYPRTQRFNLPLALSTTEKIVPGGKLLPSGLTLEQEKKMRQLEADAERIRQDIAEKQASKREAVNEWEVRERESAREGLRAELAEEGLRGLERDGESVAAF